MSNNFNLKKYLVENQMTRLSKHSKQHPNTIIYRGVRYQRLGLVNEIALTGIEPEGSITNNYTVFVEAAGNIRKTSVQAVNLMSAFEKWFNSNLNNPIMDAMLNPSDFSTLMKDPQSTYAIDNKGSVFGFPIFAFQWITDSPNIIIALDPPRNFINDDNDVYRVTEKLGVAGYFKGG